MKSDTTFKPKRVGVGMSGGVDSSVAAALLLEQGHEVIGLTLHMFKEGSRCCSLKDVQRARAVCEHLGIRHHALDAVTPFTETIITPFVNEYARGRTPSPCILCNQYIKFGLLYEWAAQLGCSHISTGHYVHTKKKDDGWRLYRGHDVNKDQSYFLHRLSQKQLERSLFPLAGWDKNRVRTYAKERNLPISASGTGESQDLCFITSAGPAPFVEQHKPELKKPGTIRNVEGNVLGAHHGIHHFTVGQRKGLGVASSAPLYVKEIDPETNTVIAGFREQVQQTECRLDDMHWIAGHPPDAKREYMIRLRYRHDGVSSRFEEQDARTLRIKFQEPQFAVAPGQAGVLYDGDEVLGGGWIGQV